MIQILNEPKDGIPALADDHLSIQNAIESLTQGIGPLAVDTERASGFRYTNRAYLLQFRRQNSGTKLIDPIGEEIDFSLLSQQISDDWIIHAASQDLPALIEIGLIPQKIFDTELAGRLLGFERVNLSEMLQRHFEIQLLKEHSAVNWSTRPLPMEWLNYAALDVELLIELRLSLLEELEEANKLSWAKEEFAYVLEKNLRPVQPKIDPWRHTSGISLIKTRLGLAVVRGLWEVRDAIARENDLAPGKVLQDRAISELAASVDGIPTKKEMYSVPGFKRRNARRYEHEWLAVFAKLSKLPPEDYPPMRFDQQLIPHQRHWSKMNPEAAERWERIRPLVVEKAEELKLPVENLISPDPLRALLWDPPTDIADFLTDHEVRQWQQEQLLPLFNKGLTESA